MIVLGIDPGQTGGLALVSDRGDKRWEPIVLIAIPMPLMNPTKKPTVNFFEAMVVMQANAKEIDHCFIENVHAMPAQGVSSSFQFGRMFGAVEMIANNLCEREPHYVTPQKWKGYFGLSRDKHASMMKATEFYGAEHWGLKKHEGVAEAALIATWGLHHLAKE
jgi:crossover junction endodeoxyribonuclease RuvC